MRAIGAAASQVRIIIPAVLDEICIPHFPAKYIPPKLKSVHAPGTIISSCVFGLIFDCAERQRCGSATRRGAT